MKPIAILAFTLFTASMVRAGDLDPVNQPTFLEGDSWTFAYTETHNGNTKKNDIVETVERLQGDKMLISIKNPAYNTPAEERLIPVDWHRERSVNGVLTIVNRPMDFPLTIGKTWRVVYTEDNPNPHHKNETYQENYKVVGWQNIKVPAGTYKALKIEDNGIWTAETNPSILDTSPTTVKKFTGIVHREFYYVPSVKCWVKSIEDHYDADNKLTSSSEAELRDFHAATP